MIDAMPIKIYGAADVHFSNKRHASSSNPRPSADAESRQSAVTTPVSDYVPEKEAPIDASVEVAPENIQSAPADNLDQAACCAICLPEQE